jgi:hypothetical protein
MTETTTAEVTPTEAATALASIAETNRTACLIAAAPDLLDALEYCLPYLPEGIGVRAVAAEAIAKAKGGVS